jgi:glycosyltransferase involved in cell wall biosynthesis
MGIESYLASSHSFLFHRLRYYSSEGIIKPKVPTNIEQNSAIEGLRRLRPDIVVVTATNNRLGSLMVAHETLARQKGNINWCWVIIDNLSTDGTHQHFKNIKDDRVVLTTSSSTDGCAYPVRNLGLDVVSSAFWGNRDVEPWITVVDSDDRLHNPYSLHELMKMTRSRYRYNHDVALVHGYSATEIHYADRVEHVANPRDTGSSFPRVESLAETVYKGLNILAGAFPISLLTNLRYPPERSFEDGGFNEKLMLQAVKHGAGWIEELYPITVKKFHRESMSNANNGRGNQAKIDRIGPYIVTGIRADIVSYYRSLMDYFVREEL